ncbi:hypothetical protein [Streptomyces beijiangensis]|uniref:Uncharacterized protein n=1 Tax=Streptomyces beijiangensis TaxID=163361 RepID=A0A939JIS4_9ACTN|nr:hypothetical protein [Streptomyces beijiangensis]MBO0515823.1 hypothetical protein [Streptomyces beijiangensis]
MSFAELSSTEAALAAIRTTAVESGRTVTEPVGRPPHDVRVEITGSPRVAVTLYTGGDTAVTVETVEFRDLERDEVVPFLRSVYGGTAFVHAVTKWHQFLLPFTAAGYWLVVPLPGDRTYKELVPRMVLTPWLASRRRP